MKSLESSAKGIRDGIDEAKIIDLVRRDCEW